MKSRLEVFVAAAQFALKEGRAQLSGYRPVDDPCVLHIKSGDEPNSGCSPQQRQQCEQKCEGAQLGPQSARPQCAGHRAAVNLAAQKSGSGQQRGHVQIEEVLGDEDHRHDPDCDQYRAPDEIHQQIIHLAAGCCHSLPEPFFDDADDSEDPPENAENEAYVEKFRQPEIHRTGEIHQFVYACPRRI